MRTPTISKQKAIYSHKAIINKALIGELALYALLGFVFAVATLHTFIVR